MTFGRVVGRKEPNDSGPGVFVVRFLGHEIMYVVPLWDTAFPIPLVGTALKSSTIESLDETVQHHTIPETVQ